MNALQPLAVCVALMPLLAAADTPRGDISRACPAIHQQLPEALARAYQEHRSDGSVQVQLRLVGDRVVDVRTEGGPRAYQRHVRTALYGVSCRIDGSANYAFEVRFADPAALGTQRLAELARLADTAR